MNLAMGIALTLHLNTAGDPNEFHPFVEIEHEGYSIGAYYNSLSETSYYLTYTFEHDSNYFLELGAVSGYRGGEIIPYGRVGYQFTDKLSVFAAPTGSNDLSRIGVVIGLEMEF